MSTARMVPRRIVFAVALYGSFALLGALAGMWYYLPHPPALSDSFVMTDLRHVGAVSGALAGGAVAAVIARRLGHSAVPVKFSFLGLLPFGPLAFILLRRDPLPGWTTIALLALPWVLAYLTSVGRTRAVDKKPVELRRQSLWPLAVLLIVTMSAAVILLAVQVTPPAWSFGIDWGNWRIEKVQQGLPGKSWHMTYEVLEVRRFGPFQLRKHRIIPAPHYMLGPNEPPLGAILYSSHELREEVGRVLDIATKHRFEDGSVQVTILLRGPKGHERWVAHSDLFETWVKR